MDLLCFLSFLSIGLVGCFYNFRNKSTSVWLKLLFIVTFLLCGISRIGHTKDISDLTHYIDYFENDNVAYFEPGYLIFTQLIQLFGSKGFYLVLGVGVFISSIIWFCIFVLENNTKERYRRKEIFFIFMMLFCVYWGLAFEAERIRVGMATTLLVLSSSLLFCGYKYIYYIPALFAVVFQYTSVIFIPFLWILNKDIKLLSKKFYTYWLICLMLFDYVNINFGLFNSLFVFNYLQLLNFDQIDHYMEYEGQVTGSYSLQYFWYHLAPLLFIVKGDFKDRIFNKSALMYYIGLTLFSILQSIPAGHRIADFFYIMIIFPLVFMFMGCKISIIKYKKIFYCYIIIQAIMCARYLSINR